MVNSAQRKRARLWLDQILNAPPRFEELAAAVLVILKKSAAFIRRKTR